MTKSKQQRKIPPPSRPGFASTDDLVRRWQVSRNTVARLAAELGLMRSPLTDRPRWSWRSVWCAEGRIDPPPSAWPALRAPLLTPAQVALLLGKYSERTIRERLSTGRLPCIRLGPRIRRIDPAVVEALAAAGEAVRGSALRRSGDGAQRRQSEANIS